MSEKTLLLSRATRHREVHTRSGSGLLAWFLIELSLAFPYEVCDLLQMHKSRGHPIKLANALGFHPEVLAEQFRERAYSAGLLKDTGQLPGCGRVHLSSSAHSRCIVSRNGLG